MVSSQDLEDRRRLELAELRDTDQTTAQAGGRWGPLGKARSWSSSTDKKYLLSTTLPPVILSGEAC